MYIAIKEGRNMRTSVDRFFKTNKVIDDPHDTDINVKSCTWEEHELYYGEEPKEEEKELN